MKARHTHNKARALSRGGTKKGWCEGDKCLVVVEGPLQVGAVWGNCWEGFFPHPLRSNLLRIGVEGTANWMVRASFWPSVILSAGTSKLQLGQHDLFVPRMTTVSMRSFYCFSLNVCYKHALLAVTKREEMRSFDAGSGILYVS